MIHAPELTNTAALHKAASFHRYEVFHSEGCGCFFCGKQFKAEEITEWTDADLTALCPQCHMDAVIPSATERYIPSQVLKDLNRYAF